MEMGEEAAVDETRGLRTAVAVVDPDVGRGRRGQDLPLILQGRIRLNDGDREVAGSVGLQVEVPQEAVAGAEAAEASLQWSKA